MQRCPGCRDVQDTYSGCRDTEIPGIQRRRNAQDAKKQGRAPATTNTRGFGLHTLTPGASSKENFSLEADMGAIDDVHTLHMMCLQKLSLPCCAVSS